MTDRSTAPERAAVGLARLAGMLRAEAANGLFWGAGPEEEARLRRLRELAAALLAEVDRRSEAEIGAIFAADTGLRTPMPGTEFRVQCADGAHLVQRRRLRSGTLGGRIAAVAAALGAEAPADPVAIADTDLAGLPCPHTYLLVYELTTTMDAAAAAEALLPGDPDLDGELDYARPEDSAVPVARPPLPVTETARRMLDQVAALAAASLAVATDHYEIERQQRIADLCADTVPAGFPYPRIDCGDLAARCVPTGADTVIFDESDRILLIRRTDTGQWCAPGGAAEVGEPVGLAAVREAAEETGLDVALTGLSWAFDKRDTDLGDGRMPLLLSFLARPLDPAQPIRLAELEATDWRWTTESEAAGLDLFRGHELRVPAAYSRHRSAR